MQTYSSQENQNNFPGPEKLPGLSRNEPQGTGIPLPPMNTTPAATGVIWRENMIAVVILLQV